MNMMQEITREELITIAEKMMAERIVLNLPTAEKQGRIGRIERFEGSDTIKYFDIDPVKNDVYKENKRKFHDDYSIQEEEWIDLMLVHNKKTTERMWNEMKRPAL